MRVLLVVTASAATLGLVGAAALAHAHRVRAREPWTERARQAAEVRWALQMLAIAQPLILGFAAALTATPDHGTPFVVGAAAFGSFVGIDLVRYRVERSLDAAGSIGNWLVRRLVSVLLNPTLLALIVGVLLVDRFRALALPWLVLAVLLLAIGGSGLMVDVARLLGGFHEPPERLSLAVERASKDGRAIPRVYRMAEPHIANAFAVASHRFVAFTDAALEVLDDDEIEAIAAHELAHLTNRRLLDRVLLQLRWLPLVLVRPLWDSLQGFAVIPLLAAPWLLTRWVHARSRREEHRCDEAARPESLARALEKLHRRNSWPAALAGGTAGTHPDLWTRMTALGMTEGRPRPEPPNQMAFASAWIVGFASLLVQLVVLIGVAAD